MPRYTPRTCQTAGCTGKHKARGYCIRCYQRLWARGDLKPLPSVDLATRFWENVDKRGPAECWPWTGYQRNAQGYGAVHAQGSKVRATHISWFLHHGEWPNDRGLWVLHKCDNPACVNPAHLWLGTAADNNRDAMRKGRARWVRGERHYQAKLTVEQVREVRRRIAAGETHRAVAAAFGMSAPAISAIASRRSWRHLD